MNAFAACIRRETWVLVVQAVPFSSGRSGWSCTKESHPAHVGGNQCEGGYTQLSKESEVKSPDKSPRGTNSGRAWLGPETPPYALQSQPCDLIDTIDLMDTARLVRCISSTTQAKVYHLSIRLIRALGYAANREEENMHRRHANPLHAFALGGQPGETGLHSNIYQTATEASVNPTQLVCKTSGSQRQSDTERATWNRQTRLQPTAGFHLARSEALPICPSRRENGSGQATIPRKEQSQGNQTR